MPKLQVHQANLQILLIMEPLRRHLGHFKQRMDITMPAWKDNKQRHTLKNHRLNIHHNELNVRGWLERKCPCSIKRPGEIPANGVFGPFGLGKVQEAGGYLKLCWCCSTDAQRSCLTPGLLTSILKMETGEVLHRVDGRSHQEIQTNIHLHLQKELQAKSQTWREALHVSQRVQVGNVESQLNWQHGFRTGYLCQL